MGFLSKLATMLLGSVIAGFNDFLSRKRAEKNLEIKGALMIKEETHEAATATRAKVRALHNRILSDPEYASRVREHFAQHPRP